MAYWIIALILLLLIGLIINSLMALKSLDRYKLPNSGKKQQGPGHSRRWQDDEDEDGW